MVLDDVSPEIEVVTDEVRLVVAESVNRAVKG